MKAVCGGGGVHACAGGSGLSIHLPFLTRMSPPSSSPPIPATQLDPNPPSLPVPQACVVPGMRGPALHLDQTPIPPAPAPSLFQMPPPHSTPQACVCSGMRGPALRHAEDLLNSTEGLPAQLCAILRDTGSGTPPSGGTGGGTAELAAAAAALRALAVLSHVAPAAASATGSSGADSVSEPFPLSQALSTRGLSQQMDRGGWVCMLRQRRWFQGGQVMQQCGYGSELFTQVWAVAADGHDGDGPVQERSLPPLHVLPPLLPPHLPPRPRWRPRSPGQCAGLRRRRPRRLLTRPWSSPRVVPPAPPAAWGHS